MICPQCSSEIHICACCYSREGNPCDCAITGDSAGARDLELVGGKWQDLDGLFRREYGDYAIELFHNVLFPTGEPSHVTWHVSGRYNIASGEAEDSESAIAAAESALLEEISKLVRVRRQHADI